MATIDASDFKAHCLAILDRVQATGERIVILKRGRPMAELRPLTRADAGYPQSELRGTVTILGDVIAPAVPPDHWECVGE
ncbi:MAG: type II toxin-antitoxin system prevent-host-death family antitoxin [Gammaproteobacteria bacterium]|nr:type II toxin-antitoxin system prevent-host-death family antitoxin [Gammaproteobacteria bacterium]MYC99399.1 type II toxin-antitoxin system prevent-host-death family antitoxin [Gammaproteobacteria bacterium]MYF62522.1 type II toxin-antitoxin system prevent-host-death family antitoxin [Gammaproteobacteria bacterium]MYI21150.1 type II toxin-antitoxin system prevent-host-death family antitoxin [Gammaproteobacteria bacterium]